MLEEACSFAGHRPVRFSFGYDEEDEKCSELKGFVKKEIRTLIQAGVSTFYTGMAQGVDQWGAEIVLSLKQEYSHIKLIAVLPCETQANKWSPEQRERYFSIVERCDKEVVLTPRYTPQCMLERNRHMIDRSHSLLAVYDGSGKGETRHTVRYAREKKKEIILIHPDTLEVVSSVDWEALERRKRIRLLPWK